jgi:hypothetical protein
VESEVRKRTDLTQEVGDMKNGHRGIIIKIILFSKYYTGKCVCPKTQ